MSAKTDDYTPRLRARYRDELVPALKEQLGLVNKMQVPRLEKVVANMGVGEAVKDGRLLDAALEDLATITGQKAVVTKARKSIAGFKLREGMAIGAKVTLRGAYMWEFIDRLVSLALPRIRDFRGLSPTAFDGHGNYTLGVTEQLIFPEIDYDKVVKVTGMDITIVTPPWASRSPRSRPRAKERAEGSRRWRNWHLSTSRRSSRSSACAATPGAYAAAARERSIANSCSAGSVSVSSHTWASCRG